MRRYSRRVAFVSLGTVGLLVMAACSSSSKKTAAAGGTTATTGTTGTTAASSYPAIPAGAPIKLGVSVPLSGATAAFGTATEKAFNNVTLKTFNAAFPDGIDGHKVQFEVLDDASDVTKAVQVANQMVADKVTAVITVSYNPEAVAQQMAVFNKNKIPVLANVLNDQYTDVSKWPYFFSMGPSDTQSGQAGGDWIAKHPEIKRIATISDGIPQATEVMNDIINAAKKTAPNVQVVQQVTVPPGAVDLSAAIAKLKASNPDLLMVFTSYGFGPLWQAIQAAGWTPKILSGSIFYDGFTAIGNLANTTNVLTFPCVQEGHAPFPKTLTDPMDGYATVFGTSSVNYVLFVTSDNGPIELLKQAIEKHHSIDPDAIKNGLETIGDYKVGGAVDYDYSPTNHFGLTGTWGANVCKATGFSDGPYRVPVIAP